MVGKDRRDRTKPFIAERSADRLQIERLWDFRASRWVGRDEHRSSGCVWATIRVIIVVHSCRVIEVPGMRSIRHIWQATFCAVFVAGCAPPLAKGPSPSLRLQHIVLYQNGLGYFERTGTMKSDRLSLRFREREVDDVLKSVVVVEQGLGPKDTPSTVSALLPRSGRADGLEEPTELELVFSPRPTRPVSIAYAVPAAAWKATYRIILPTKEQKERQALLQAWALIDNVGDEDWNNVRVTLATGSPLSYASDLRSPTMMQRPELKGVYGAANRCHRTGLCRTHGNAGSRCRWYR